METVDLYNAIHKGLRNLLSRFLFQAGATDWTEPQEIAHLNTQWHKVLNVVHSHHTHEDKFIHPILSRVIPGGHITYENEHKALVALLDDLNAHLQRLAKEEEAPSTVMLVGQEFYRALTIFFAEFLRHMDREETLAQRALNELCIPEELGQALGGIISSIPPDEMMYTLDFMMPALSANECVDMLKGMKAGAPPDAFEAMTVRIESALGKDRWLRVQARMVV